MALRGVYYLTGSDDDPVDGWTLSLLTVRAPPSTAVAVYTSRVVHRTMQCCLADCTTGRAPQQRNQSAETAVNWSQWIINIDIATCC